MKRIVVFFSCMLFILSVKAAEYDPAWTIRTTDYNTDRYFGVAVANGGIGILPSKDPFSIQHVILNHVFDATDVSTVLQGINPFNMRMLLNGLSVNSNTVSDWEQVLNMKNAFHRTHFKSGSDAEITYTVYALRNMPYTGLVCVEVKALKNLNMTVENEIRVPDLYKKDVQINCMNMTTEGKPLQIVRKAALSANRGVKVSASSTFLFDVPDGVNQYFDGDNSFSVSIAEGATFHFTLIGSVCTDKQFIDPCSESDREVIYVANRGLDRTLALHDKLWNEMWEGDIQIEGDDEAQRVVRLALYDLYSSARANSRLSIPPFGLSSQGYNGHIFWDTELWMYPPMLFLNKGIAESMMDYRIDRLEPARQKAYSYGFDGAMYPWESDAEGEEACPTWAMTGAFEHHITPDIAIALWNYYRMYKDKQWLQEEAYPVLKAIAEFCVTRADKNEDGSYSIRNVVCPDEYAINVDDNAFTNGSAIIALRNAMKAAAICGEKVPAEWKKVADGLRIPRSEDGVTLEYEGYDGRVIKQADVNLLSFPLNFITDIETIKKDLAYYEDKIDKGGPTMSFSALAAQHARLGDADKAYELFLQAFRPNQLPPFGVLAEGAGGSNPDFMTGAGGLLQTVINGFCGLEITDQGIKQIPSVLPKHWKKLTITGVGPDKKTYTRTQK